MILVILNILKRMVLCCVLLPCVVLCCIFHLSMARFSREKALVACTPTGITIIIIHHIAHYKRETRKQSTVCTDIQVYHLI
jgi:hypothetical protein